MAKLQEGVTMSTLFDAPVSLFRGAMDAHPLRTTTVGAVLEVIRTDAYRAPIEQLRHLRLAVAQAAYNAAKQRLDAVTFGGTFAPTRSKTTLLRHSGVVHGDLDHLNDLQATKQALCADAYTAYCFTSPGGDGLKLGVSVELVQDGVRYQHVWQTVADYFHTQYAVRWDPSGKDVCRLCFLSWDPALCVNLDAQPFPVPPVQAAVPSFHTPAPPRRIFSNDRRDGYARQALDRATHLIDVSIPGQQHYARCKAAYLLGGYIGGGLLAYDDVDTALQAAVGRTAKDVRRAMQTIAACLEAGMQAPITADDVAQERLAWRATHWHTRARAWTGQLRTVTAEEIPPWH
jgi:hypothetical protein